MKIKYLFLIALFCIATLLLPNISVSDYTQWSLPEDAKIRLGKGTIKQVKLSPDGTLLAVASSIGVWLYDVQTGEELVLLTGHTGNVNSVAFSIDGKTLASHGEDHTIRLWEVSTGTHLKTLKAYIEPFPITRTLCFSPDGRTLASISLNGTIQLWRVAYGTHLKTLKGDSSTIFISIAFSGDGKTLASVSFDKNVDLWDAISGERIKTLTLTEVATSTVFSVFSGDGTTLASKGDDNNIHLWDTASGEYVKTLKGDAKSVSSVTFSRDGNTLASASGDEIYLWDTTSGTHRKISAAHRDSIISLDFSSDGKTLVSASEVEVCLWDAISGKHLKTLTGHTKEVTNIAFSSDGKTLASTSGKEIYLWDATSGKQRKTLTRHTEPVNDIALSSDGKFLAGAIGNEIYLWDAASGKHINTLSGHTEEVTSVAFSPDGKTLASSSSDKTIRLWDAVSGEHQKTLTGHSVGDITFGDYNTLVGESGKEIHLWDAVSGEHLKILEEHTDPIFNIDVCNATFGFRIASVDWRGKICLWNIVNFDEFSSISKRTFTTEHTEIKVDPIGIALDERGRRLASTDLDKIHLWDVEVGTQRKTLIGHTRPVTNIAFADDSNTLASASEDDTVLLWNANIRRLQKPELKPEDIAKKAMASTVVVMSQGINKEGVFERLGSGFVLPITYLRRCIIATNYHVVKHFFNDELVLNSYVKLVNTDKRYNIKKIVEVDKKNDLAILEINGLILDSLDLGDSNKVEFGMSICAVGNPRGMEGTPSWGTVTGIREENSKKLFQIDAAVSKGSSGGPLLNDRGEVIGIVVSGVEEGLDLNFAIPSNYLKELIEKAKEKE